MIEKLIRDFNTAGKITIAVKVIPKSSRTEIIGKMDDGTIKIRVAAVPEKNKANTELIKFLAKTFSVDKTLIRILSGETGHKKIIEIK